MKTQSKIREEYRLRGMVCTRCIKVIREELTAIGVDIKMIKLGFVEIEYDRQKTSTEAILDVFTSNDFEIIPNDRESLVEEVRQLIYEYIWNLDHLEGDLVNISEFLAIKLNMNYGKMSRLFSETSETTIEKYSSKLKIERAKSLIEEGEFQFSEIAYRLGYNNVSALSRQFKIETGMTMTEYKNNHLGERLPINRI